MRFHEMARYWRIARHLTKGAWERLRGRLEAVARKAARARAIGYLRRVGVMQYIVTGSNKEIPADVWDLFNLHRTVRRIRPWVAIEFGVGFSTLAITHAMYMNFLEASGGRKEKRGEELPLLWTTDASADWIENAKKRIPEYLQSFVVFRHSAARTCIWSGELCHMYENIPNVVPQFIYIDGPDPRDVEGEINGLTFRQLETGNPRHVVAADVLLYESSLKPGAHIIVDGRQPNVGFLKRNLKRNYVIKTHRLMNCTSFRLTR